jgi:hypothetical protein
MSYKFVKETALQLFQLWILGVAIVRGAVLILDPDATIVYLGWPGGVEPAWLWGGFTIFLGVLGIVGQTWTEFGSWRNSWILSFTAHAGLTGVYIVYGISAIRYVTGEGDREPSLATALEILGYGFCHWLFVNRSKRAVI